MKAPRLDTIRGSLSLVMFLFYGKLSALPPLFLLLLFLSLSSTFSAAKHPSEDYNSEDGWLDPFLLKEEGYWLWL